MKKLSKSKINYRKHERILMSRRLRRAYKNGLKVNERNKK